MNIKIKLTEQELSVFATRVNLVNQQQEQLTRLTQELQLNRETLNAIWKSIYKGWQLESPDDRTKISFQDNMEIRLENGFILCSVADAQKLVDNTDSNEDK